MSKRCSTLWLALGDAALTFGAYALAFLIWLGGFPAENWERFLRIAPFLMGTTFLVLLLYNGYRDLHRPYLEMVGAWLIASQTPSSWPPSGRSSPPCPGMRSGSGCGASWSWTAGIS